MSRRRSVAWQIARPPIVPGITRARRALRDPAGYAKRAAVYSIVSPALPRSRRARRATRLAWFGLRRR
jgi:hypothetical protein